MAAGRGWATTTSLAVFLAIAACGQGAIATDFVEIPGIGQTRIDAPRPTGSAGSCRIAIPADETVAERVASLRSAGLFADRGSLSEAELAAEIEKEIVDLWGEVPTEPLLAELAVAEGDGARVWWRDLEADVSRGNEVYATTIAEWAAISDGAFEPTAIIETWGTEAGPVEVTFTHGGETVALRPEYLEDWIDPRILVPINERISVSGRQFTLFQAFDQTAVVIAPTDSERLDLERRGWCFE